MLIAITVVAARATAVIAAMGYGVKRAIYGSNRYKDEHWNFKQVALDAFGNAVGNAIVASMMPATPQQASKKAKAASRQAILNGASPQQAKAIELQTYVQESGGTMEPVERAESNALHGTFGYEEDDGFWVSTSATDRIRVSRHASISEVEGYFGNSPAAAMAMQFTKQMLGVYQNGDAAFSRGVELGERKTAELRAASRSKSGIIDVDYAKHMAADDAMWGRGRMYAQRREAFLNNEHVVRVFAGLQAIEGAVVTATGALLSTTGWGTLAGGPMIAFGHAGALAPTVAQSS